MRKVHCSFLACFLAFSSVATDKSTDSAEVDKIDQGKEDFLNIKVAHERSNEHPFGAKNSSAIALNPVLFLLHKKNFVLEGDVYYGRQFTFGGYLKSAKNWSTMVADRAEFYKEFDMHKKNLNATTENTLGKAHFYRNWTRGVYTNSVKNFRVVAGDTTTRNTVGFQQALSGGGISIFRQNGNGSIINGGSPIVITRLSKVECRLNGEIIALQIFRPGVYSVNDLPEEAKLPGVSVKISDQLNRSEILNVDYFNGYETLALGEDDFDITVLFSHKWDLEDPMKLKYKSKPRYSANYMYGYTDSTTLGIGCQIYKSSFTIDGTAIFAGRFGKISPNVAYSNSSHIGKKTRRTGGIGVFYSIPKNEHGIFIETSLAFRGRGYGDLDNGADLEDTYNAFIDKYFTTEAAKAKFRNSSKESSSRQITFRLYSKPVWGITPAFVFNGEWGSSGETGDNKLREYTMSLTRKITESCTCVLVAGLTYDDPSKGRNLRSPDRRLTIAMTIDLNREFSVQESYVHYDDELRRWHGSATYAPIAINGLELCTEIFRRPGVSNPCFSIKYDTKFFGIKMDESITNTYKDKEASTSNGHSNRQRIFFGTSISKAGFKSHRNGGFNILR